MEATAQVMGFLIASLDPALVLIATLAFPTSSLKMKQYTSVVWVIQLRNNLCNHSKPDKGGSRFKSIKEEQCLLPEFQQRQHHLLRPADNQAAFLQTPHLTEDSQDRC